jgi:membrane protease YdiL (CAAX protease family)
LKRLFLILDIVLYCVLYVLSIYLSKLLILIAVSAKTAFEFLENRMLLRGGDFSEAVTEVFSKQTLPALLLSYLLFFLLCYITFKIKKKDLTGYAGYGGARFFGIIGAAVTGTVLNLLICGIMKEFTLPEKWIINHNDTLTRLFNGNTILVLATVVVLAPMFEEFFFRGVLFKTFLSAFGPAAAVISTAVLFAIAHFNPVQSIYSFIVGLVLGVIRCKSKSLWSSTAAHIAFNSANFISLGFTPPLYLYVALLALMMPIACIRKRNV